MTNFRIILAYNGTAYHGWQRQNNALAVQQVLEEAILSLTGQTVTVNGCSRTDAGVHARRFCASFLIESTITCRGIVFGLNSKLPDDISVLECEKVPLDFHARYMCSGKEYEYMIYLIKELSATIRSSSADRHLHATSAQRRRRRSARSLRKPCCCH